jgi:hypothetical protein
MIDVDLNYFTITETPVPGIIWSTGGWKVVTGENQTQRFLNHHRQAEFLKIISRISVCKLRTLSESFTVINTVSIQGGSNMTGTNCDLFTHKESRSYLNHLVINHTQSTHKFRLNIVLMDKKES